MSGQTFTSSTSYSSSSYSSSNGQATGSREIHTSQTDPSGTTVKSASQKIGEPIVQETRQYDTQGRELLTGAGGMQDTSRRIEDVSDTQADRDYRERMEDEYAKREGGA